jgi:hypothetical protein
MRPGTSGRWIRLRPRVRGTDGSGLETGDNPQQAPKKDDFLPSRLRVLRCGRSVRPCSAVFEVPPGVPSGREKGV